MKDPFLSHLCRRKPWFMLIAYQNMALKFLAPFFTKLHNLVAEAAFSREIRLESSARQKGGWGSAFNAVKEGHVTNYGAHWWTYLKIYNFNQQSTKSGDCTTLIFWSLLKVYVHFWSNPLLNCFAYGNKWKNEGLRKHGQKGFRNACTHLKVPNLLQINVPNHFPRRLYFFNPSLDL